MTNAVTLASLANSGYLRNRIINGNMMIDQRNAGASVTITAGGVFGPDRWQGFEDTDGTMTMQQSSTAPVGFSNSLLFTTTSADSSLGASQYVTINQNIEGLNVSDLAWGTANAKTVTLSFQVRSSLTGAFGGAVRNSAADRSYPFSFTIDSANTWESKTVTIPGDTTGTWLTTNGIGVRITFSLGAGASLSGTPGAWAGANYVSATGANSVIGTNGATFYITGVQLEVGTQATPFEWRPITVELQLCQRYYAKTFPLTTVAGNNKGVSGSLISNTGTFSTSVALCARWQYPVIMRASPTVSLYNPQSGTAGYWGDYFGGAPVYNPGTPAANDQSMLLASATTAGTSFTPAIHAVAEIEL